MRHVTIPILLLLSLALVGCRATRNTPCETIKTSGDDLVQRNDQENRNTDTTAAVAVADSDGDANASPSSANVESQHNQNQMAPQQDTKDLFGSAQMAKNILEHTSAGEAATIRQLQRVEAQLAALADQQAAGMPVDPNAVGSLNVMQAELVARLDKYSQEKWDRAASIKGMDLSSLESIVITLTSSQSMGGEPSAMDKSAQKESMMGVAREALKRGGDK